MSLSLRDMTFPDLCQEVANLRREGASTKSINLTIGGPMGEQDLVGSRTQSGRTFKATVEGDVLANVRTGATAVSTPARSVMVTVRDGKVEDVRLRLMLVPSSLDGALTMAAAFAERLGLGSSRRIREGLASVRQSLSPVMSVAGVCLSDGTGVSIGVYGIVAGQTGEPDRMYPKDIRAWDTSVGLFAAGPGDCLETVPSRVMSGSNGDGSIKPQRLQ
jgi:hypothetical protein